MSIEEIDTNTGVLNCGSADSYLSVLETFRQTADKKADEIESYYNEGDIENYTIKVHALKSSARIIGAAALSDMARALEDAGKAGDEDTIKRDTAALLTAYRGLYDKLLAGTAEDTDLKEMTDGMRLEAFQTMGEIAESMDYGLMEDILHDIRTYRLSAEDSVLIGQIEDRLTELDWDGIIKLVREDKDKNA